MIKDEIKPEVKSDERKKREFLRMQYLVNMVQSMPKLWKMPKSKPASKVYTPNGKKECARRVRQQHRDRVC